MVVAVKISFENRSIPASEFLGRNRNLNFFLLGCSSYCLLLRFLFIDNRRLGSIATPTLLMIIITTVESTTTSATTASTTSAFATASSILLNLLKVITVLILVVIRLIRLLIAFLFAAIAIFASFKWAVLGSFTLLSLLAWRRLSFMDLDLLSNLFLKL